MTIGTNYGINDEYTYYEFSLDSLDAKTSRNSSNTSLNWPEFQIESVQDVVAMKVIEADIPFSYYVFNQYNNTFILGEHLGAIHTYSLVTIDPGNYNGTTIIAPLQSALNAASPNVGAVPGGWNYIVSYSAAQGKFAIIATAAPVGGTFSFVFGGTENEGNTNPRLWLGFTPGETFSSASASMIAPNVAMIEGPNYLYLNSSLGNEVDLWLPDNAQLLPNKGTQLATIPVNVNKFAIINWQDPDPQKWFSVDIQNFCNIDFYVTMGNDPRKLDFNGQPFHIKLGLLKQNKSLTIRQTGTLEQGGVVKKMRTI